MNNTIVLNSGNIISELESKNLKICFINNTMCIEDLQKNLYEIEDYRHGSYLDNLIKNKIVVKFNLVKASISKNIGDCGKEIWGIEEVKAFIKRQFL